MGLKASTVRRLRVQGSVARSVVKRKDEPAGAFKRRRRLSEHGGSGEERVRPARGWKRLGVDMRPWPNPPPVCCWFEFSSHADGSMDGSLYTNRRRGVLLYTRLLIDLMQCTAAVA